MTQRLIGGLRVFPEGTTTPDLGRGRGGNATRPLAELLIDGDEGRVLLRLRGRWFRALMRLLTLGSEGVFEWTAPLASVTAEAFGSWEMTRGVVLRAAGQPPAIFWCGIENQRAVLTALPRYESPLLGPPGQAGGV